GVDPACPLLDCIGETREFVATEFDALLHDGRSSVGGVRAGAGCRTCVPPAYPVDSEAFLEHLPAELAARVRPLAELPKVKILRDESKVRLARLINRAAHAVNEA